MSAYPFPSPDRFKDGFGGALDFAPAHDLQALADELIERHPQFEHLNQLRVEWLWKARGGEKAGKAICERDHIYCLLDGQVVGTAAHVHHLTYERIGHEDLADLLHVCEPCHQYLSGLTDDDPVERERQIYAQDRAGWASESRVA